MLPKLKMLMLLATIVPETLSAPTNATKNISLLPQHPDRLEALMAALHRLDFTTEQFLDLVQHQPIILGRPVTDFSYNFLKALIDDEPVPRNIIFSPFSIHTAMTSLYLATPKSANSHKQLAEALSLRDEDSREYLLSFYKLLDFYEKDTDVHLANNVFLKGRFAINPSFLQLMYGFYGTKPESLNRNFALAEIQVNKFVEENTNGAIKNILSGGTLSAGTEVLVVNAIHHHGPWAIKFDKAETGPMDFTLLGGKVIQYPFGMRLQNEDLEYAETREMTVVALRYKNRRYKMYAVLPTKTTIDALDEVTKYFDLEEVEKKLHKHNIGVKLLMPRLDLSYTANLNRALSAMGVKDIFDAGTAQLSHMTNASAGIHQIVHETRVTINEEGSEAAAATTVFVCTRECPIPVEISFNRPFSVFIVDATNGIPLFVGRVVNPSEQGQEPLPIKYPNGYLPIAYPNKPQ